jgi:hypothetical protein
MMNNSGKEKNQAREKKGERNEGRLSGGYAEV